MTNNRIVRSGKAAHSHCQGAQLTELMLQLDVKEGFLQWLSRLRVDFSKATVVRPVD